MLFGTLQDKDVTIALVGKYIALHDAYISVVEALKHGGIAERATVNIKWVDSEDVTDENAADIFSERAILSLRAWSSACSERHTMMSGWIPIPCSSFTLAWVVSTRV